MASQIPALSGAFAALLQDSLLTPAAFALPAAASTSTNSTAIDLGAGDQSATSSTGGGPYVIGTIELELNVPALSTTIVPNASTVTYSVQLSTTSNFASIATTILYDTVTGAGGVGVAAYQQRVRLPSTAPRYARFVVTFGAATTTGAAVNATPAVYVAA